MIAANKRLLKATLTEGVLGIQINLIQLYQSNLSAVATQAALIAGFAFGSISTTFEYNGQYGEILSYLFYSCFTVSFCSSLFALSQATIVTMFGPSMALKADDSDAVRIASEYMRQQQIIVFNIGIISITAMFLGAMFLSWAIYDIKIASMVTFIYSVGYYVIIHYGTLALDIFLPTVDVTIDENLEAQASKRSGPMAKFGGKSVKDPSSQEMTSVIPGGNDAQSEAGKSTMTSASVLMNNDPLERIRLKAKGVIWRRKPLEKGGTFVKVFCVLEKGKLDFYNSEQHYINHENPITTHPVKLWQQNLETDPRKFARSVTSLRNTIKAAMLGNEDFYVTDIMSSEHDLVYASKNYKFALLPKVSSELVATEIVELLSHDEKSFRQWVRALSTVCDAYDEIAASPSIEHTMRAGTSDVETVVQAANVLTTRFN